MSLSAAQERMLKELLDLGLDRPKCIRALLKNPLTVDEVRECTRVVCYGWQRDRVCATAAWRCDRSA